jgi:hypothetical protein
MYIYVRILTHTDIQMHTLMEPHTVHGMYLRKYKCFDFTVELRQTPCRPNVGKQTSRKFLFLCSMLTTQGYIEGLDLIHNDSAEP